MTYVLMPDTRDAALSRAEAEDDGEPGRERPAAAPAEAAR